MVMRNKIAYSPYYEGLMIWRPESGCASFDEREYPTEESARFMLNWYARELDAEVMPPGSLDRL